MSDQGFGLLVILFFFGLAGGVIGRMKGSSFLVWFLISALVPFLGLLTAVFYRWENRELRRECPGCGKVVILHDAICMGCATELEFPEVAIASESDVREARWRAQHADQAVSAPETR
jgi:hypothetical protein